MADYAKKLRSMRETVEQSDSGMTRSDETKGRLKNLDARIKQSESAGAGRGEQGGPTAAQARQNRGMMSDAERAARDEAKAMKEQADADKAYEASRTSLKKGGTASSRADGCACKGKTRGKLL